MKNILKEPLLHFLVIGALIFIFSSSVNDPPKKSDRKKIVVTSEDIERLSVNWSKKWNRSPIENELQGLVDSYIREEVYYREALAQGLDQDDMIIRRRLMQKMEFLSNDLAVLNTPDETSLDTYFLKHKGKYELPARVSFTHIYFSFDKRGINILQDAENVLDEILAAPSPVVRAPDRGDPYMMQYDFSLATSSEVSRLFGQSFSELLFQLEKGNWQGPIESGYGLHLVRINEKNDAQMPELASIIDKVRTDWMFEQREKSNEEIYERFKARYEIVIEKMPE